MLSQIRIQNFKAWQDTGEIRLAPLTVFFGANSSGKTSLIQFLLMLKQTAQSTDRKRVLHFGDSESFVDLGVFPEMVFNHAASENISFHIQWTPIQLQAYLPTGVTLPGSATRLNFDASVGQDSESSNRLAVKEFMYQIRIPDGFLAAGMRRKDGGTGYTLITTKSKKNDITPKPERTGLLPPPVRFYGFPSEVHLQFENTRELDDFAFMFTQQMADLHYLGPLRRRPQRLYSWSGAAPENVGVAGERAVEALLAVDDHPHAAGPRHPSRSFKGAVAEWLQKLGLLVSFEARPIAKHRKEYELLVQPTEASRAVHLMDVGFGVSQVLPVVVQCLYASPGSTLILEHPELHLHPHAQTELADLFINTIDKEGDGKPRHIQLLIESHSEHLLRRIQRRIAEGRLKPEQAALYFCSSGPQGSRIEELQLDEYGRITNWPTNFFGDAVGESEGQIEAMLHRMEKEDKNVPK